MRHCSKFTNYPGAARSHHFCHHRIDAFCALCRTWFDRQDKTSNRYDIRCDSILITAIAFRVQPSLKA